MTQKVCDPKRSFGSLRIKVKEEFDRSTFSPFTNPLCVSEANGNMPNEKARVTIISTIKIHYHYHTQKLNTVSVLSEAKQELGSHDNPLVMS